MSASDVFVILPLITLSAAIIIIMLLITILRNHLLTFIATLISLVISIAALCWSIPGQPYHITDIFVMDSYASFNIALIFVTVIVITIFSYGYEKKRDGIKEEYYIFLLTATLGAAMLVGGTHFVVLFIGIELLSLSLYVLIAYSGKKLNIEAGLKYFVPAAVSIAFLLFGTALIYGGSGTMRFAELSYFVQTGAIISKPLFFAGIGFVLVGVCFKLALVPFHFWAPDVFEGAPVPVTAFLATISKGAVFVVIMRYFSAIDIINNLSLFYIFAVIATASMFFGNITALLQNNIKRILAYSSIAHFGYLLVTLMAGGSVGIAAASFYLVAYFITTLIAFGVIAILSGSESDYDNIDDYRGLVHRHPCISSIMALAMLSLAGIPLTAGFIAKFYIITAGASVRLWILLVILVINSVIGLFYYLRIVAALFGKSAELSEYKTMPAFSFLSVLTITILAAALLWLGVNPSTFIQIVQKIAASLI
jgi:NADH-quinone oxidoreductase subunit N